MDLLLALREFPVCPNPLFFFFKLRHLNHLSVVEWRVLITTFRCWPGVYCQLIYRSIRRGRALDWPRRHRAGWRAPRRPRKRTGSTWLKQLNDIPRFLRFVFIHRDGKFVNYSSDFSKLSLGKSQSHFSSRMFLMLLNHRGRSRSVSGENPSDVVSDRVKSNWNVYRIVNLNIRSVSGSPFSVPDVCCVFTSCLLHSARLRELLTSPSFLRISFLIWRAETKWHLGLDPNVVGGRGAQYFPQVVFFRFALVEVFCLCSSFWRFT